MSVEGCRDVRLNLKIDSGTKMVTLENVFHVPNFKFFSLLVKLMNRKGLLTVFSESELQSNVG